jgi:hypothetical protein
MQLQVCPEGLLHIIQVDLIPQRRRQSHVPPQLAHSAQSENVPISFSPPVATPTPLPH